MSEFLWFLVVAGGPLVLLIAIIYAVLTRRRKSVGEAAAQRQATRHLYEDDTASAPAQDRVRDEKAQATSPAVESLRREKPAEAGSELEEGLEDTFPASDPVAPTSGTTSGSPRGRDAV